MSSDNELQIADAAAYWITPGGDIIPVRKSHIDEVFDNPRLFGLSMEYLESVYDECREPCRLEGRARERILLMLFKKGWIRARRYHRPDRWTLNVYSLTGNSIENIKYFASSMISKGHSVHEEIIIDLPGGQVLLTMGDVTDRIPLSPIQRSRDTELL